MESNLRTYFKWFLGIVGTVLLGAIGSGVWDWILSGFFSWLGASLLSIAGGISQTYLDLLYKDIWKGPNYAHLKEIYILTFVIYLMMPVLLVFSRKKRKVSKSKKPTNLIALLFLSASLAVMLTIKIWETTFTVKAASVLKANIFIVKPNISSEEYFNLESMLYSVKDEKSAIELKDSIVSISEKKNIKIHSMDFI